MRMNPVRITVKPTKPLPCYRSVRTAMSTRTQAESSQESSRTSERVKWTDRLCAVAEIHVKHSIFTTSTKYLHENEVEVPSSVINHGFLLLLFNF
jgi:hypothetical protein